ncbi:hypothetical protein MPDQ_001763 [Monascus purpureus]|uniref:Uncharacterized protein n=1 Tax=Monascus purpureus TaxID=5098 RepID=A0A507R3K6_MONPU|nr:hypothetical protein MPDQ_001763 [Monascus purpureus]
MPLVRDYFDNDGVRNATNPSRFGHHYGPIPNPGWLPDRQRAARDNDLRLPDVTAAENATAPQTGTKMSSVNTLVCNIDVNSGQMCGMHDHVKPAFTPPPPPQCASRRCAIKSFVLSGGWRKARYVHEPGCGPLGGLLDTCATACETIALLVNLELASIVSHKRKRGPSPPDDGSNNNSGSDLNTSRR